MNDRQINPYLSSMVRLSTRDIEGPISNLAHDESYRAPVSYFGGALTGMRTWLSLSRGHHVEHNGPEDAIKRQQDMTRDSPSGGDGSEVILCDPGVPMVLQCGSCLIPT